MSKAGAIENKRPDLIDEDSDIRNKGADLIDDDGEVRELIAADFARMKPFSSLPPELQHVLREIQRGNVTIRPDED